MRLQRHINFKSGRVKKIEIDRDPVPLPSVTDGVLVLGWGARTVSLLQVRFRLRIANDTRQ